MHRIIRRPPYVQTMSKGVAFLQLSSFWFGRSLYDYRSTIAYTSLLHSYTGLLSFSRPNILHHTTSKAITGYIFFSTFALNYCNLMLCFPLKWSLVIWPMGDWDCVCNWIPSFPDQLLHCNLQVINDQRIRGKCYGFVTYTDPTAAQHAIMQMDGKV